MIADIELLELFFAHTLSPLVVAIVVPFAATVTLGFIHWSLPLVLIPALAVVATVPSWLQRRAETQGRAVREQAAEMGAEVVDAIQGLREVARLRRGRARARPPRPHRPSCLHRAQLAHGRPLGRRARRRRRPGHGRHARRAALPPRLATAGTIADRAVPARRRAGRVHVSSVTTLVDSARDLNLVAAAAERVAAILEEPTRVPDLVSAPPAGPIEPRVRFDGVSLRYGAGLPDALHDASFEIAPGETVALVGHSGAGKSTAAHLLLRFWDVAAGAISRRRPRPARAAAGHAARARDVRPAGHLPLPQLRRRQHPPRAARRERRAGRRAARQALADEFIERLPDAYETIVGERGSKLSGGQRQRIALARAVLKDSPILVMDEPVSNLDAESELELRSAMAEARRGRTVLVIAHRLSTIKTADRLVVLDRGRVAETGRHDDLLAAGGTYARLIASQRIEAS